MTGPVGYYVHHAGSGHGALGSALSTVLGEGLVGLGSGGRPPGWRGGWIDLPPDDRPPVAADPTRGGAWHWVPPGHAGFTDRMRAIASWVADARPAALVTDVSCEVTVLGALLGVPTVAVLLAGRRDDRPHRLAWDSADALVGPWPAGHREPWTDPWADRLTPLGLVSRFDDRPVPPPPASDRHVVVLRPGGDHRFDDAAVAVAARVTAPAGWRWTVIGGPGARVEDPWPVLVEATVVVAAAGLASVAEIAAARRPAVLLPQPRPFAEQDALARHLDGVAPVVVADRWPAAADWPAVLARAAALDPARWDPLHDRGGAARFAAVVASVAVGADRVSPAGGAESGRRCPTSPLSTARPGPSPTPSAPPSPRTSTPTSPSSGAGSPG